jgi:hypothetical protein
MPTPNNGGPAFLVHATHALFNGNVVAVHEQGMTLRDYFAGESLPIASKGGYRTGEAIAKRAYYIADAMLAEREKGGK